MHNMHSGLGFFFLMVALHTLNLIFLLLPVSALSLCLSQPGRQADGELAGPFQTDSHGHLPERVHLHPRTAHQCVPSLLLTDTTLTFTHSHLAHGAH